MAIEESNHEGWSFKEQGIVENNVKVNLIRKEITFNMMKHAHYTCNQMSNAEDGSSNEKHRKKKMWQTPLDSQSPCDVIINSSLLQNMCAGGWTLKLQMQSGDCRIIQIGYMRGVGNAWCY